jgi:hypothetical protein
MRELFCMPLLTRQPRDVMEGHTAPAAATKRSIWGVVENPRRVDRLLRRFGPTLIACCVVLIAPAIYGITNYVPSTEQVRPSQEAVEAAYLYNFTKFVYWPASAAGTPLAICVMGRDSFHSSLQQIVKGQIVNNRPLAFHQIKNIAQAQACSLLFLSSGDDEGRDVRALEGSPVLTVSDDPGFLERGGVIQFLIKDERVRFSVNLPAARHNGLEISSELLKVAVRVIGSPLPEESQ